MTTIRGRVRERKSPPRVWRRVFKALNFRHHWRELQRGRPGHRFQDRFDRRRQRQGGTGTGERIVFLVVATISLLIGLVLAVFPGPAIPFFIIAGGFLALLSRTFATWMDALEIQARRVAHWGGQRWRKLPGVARVFLMMLGAGASATAAYISIRFLRG